MMIFLLALLSGGAIAVQATMNARLGQLLGSPLYATTVAFGVGFVLVATVALVYSRLVAPPRGLAAVPLQLWCAGGLLGTLALVSLYWLIPKIGIGPTVSLALAGQLLVALVAGHLGWFGLPRTPITATRAVGAGALLLGAFLVQRPQGAA
jgi:transporter family-2 protein